MKKSVNYSNGCASKFTQFQNRSNDTQNFKFTSLLVAQKRKKVLHHKTFIELEE